MEPEALAASAQIDTDLEKEETPTTLAAEAVRRLLSGRSELAVGLLETAWLQRSEDVRILNDLAAAYLVSGSDAGKATDLLEGLVYADEASRLAPEQPEPLFNLALALQSVHLRHRAREAWEAYLGLDSRSPWADLARLHLRRLEAPSPLDRWEDLRGRVETGGRGRALDLRDRLRGFPQQALEFAESDVLKRWALAASSGDASESERNLEILESIAAAIPPESGARPLRATTELIGRAGGPRAVRLAEAHALLFDGVSAYERGDLAGARDALATASEVLAFEGSPFAARARFHLALCLYQERRFTPAASLLSDLIESARSDGDLLVEGRALHLLGLIEGIQGRPADALREYRSALDLYRRAGWTGRAVAMEGLLAEMEEYLGDPDAAWEHRLRGLAGLGWIGDPKTRFRTWSEATAAAGRRSAALAVQFGGAMTEAAQRVDDPLTRAIASRHMGSVLAAQGELDESLARFDEALRWAEEVESQNMGDNLRGDILLRRAEVLAETAPREALHDLDRAEGTFLEQDNRVAFARLFRARARSLITLGDSDRAVDELTAAMERSDEIAASVGDPFAYSSFLGVSRQVYDAAIGLNIDLGRSYEALLLADRFRSSTMQAWSRRAERPPYSPPPARLPAATTVLFFHSLPDRLAVWTLHEDESRLTVVPRSRGELVRDVDGVRRALTSGSQHGSPLSVLSRTLLPNPLPRSTGTQRVIIVPGDALYGVPFQALSDPGTHRRLLADFDVVVTPSLSLALDDSTEAAATTFGRTTTVLAMGNPRPPPGLVPPAQSLPGAEGEVHLIGELFPRTDVYTGSAATESRFLEGLGSYDIVHFAGHGRSNPESPWLSTLVLAPGEGDDGILSIKDIPRRSPGGTRMIVLSSCALGPNANMGLTQAMVGSGIPIVIEALWEVGDPAAKAFSAAFYRRLQGGLDVLAAFSGAQRELRTSQDERWGHPSTWAAFRITLGKAAEDIQPSRHEGG